jgi:dihydrofolate reductase
MHLKSEGPPVPELISELIVSLDMHARGKASPGYYGYLGPEFELRLKSNAAEPHGQLLGRKTYEMLNSLPEQNRDEGWRRMAATPGYLFSRSLAKSDWPGLQLVKDDGIEFVRELKASRGPELRILGSLSLIRQFREAGLIDRMKLWVCPVVLPVTGDEPVFDGWPDEGFELVNSVVLDGRILELDYRLAGHPPRT